MLNCTTLELMPAGEVDEKWGGFEDGDGLDLNPHDPIPLNLGEWFTQDVLLLWVQQAARWVAWEGLRFSGAAASDDALYPGSMRGLLAFAYITDVFDGEAIVRRCEFPGPFRTLAGGATPYLDDLIRFRRRNVELLISTVAIVLERAVRERLRFSGSALPSQLEAHFHELALERLMIAHHLDSPD